MGFRFRKTIKSGPVNINLSQSGVGYSVGAGGLRYTHSPKRKKKSSAETKRKKKSSAETKRKGTWRIAIGLFCLIGGLANFGDNLGACIFGVVIGCSLLFWGIRASKTQ